jgi:hypothetical protein
MGFVLEPEEAAALIAKNPKNKEVLFPYLNGQDLNTNPDQAPSRWVINFFDWLLDADHDDPRNPKGPPYAADYPDCLEIVEKLVKPEREKLTQESEYAVLQSELHWNWVLLYGNKLETRPQYTPTDCFETFPFPDQTDSLETIGEQYYHHRQSIMQTRQEGLTKTYNRFHDPTDTNPDILKLRQLHTQMDRAVATAYGWTDLALNHDFYDTPQGTRYTLHPTARQHILDRLLVLNHQRYAEEVKQGLHNKGKGKSKTAKTKAKFQPTPSEENQISLL